MLNAQVPQFDNPGFEESAICDPGDCDDYSIACVDGWWWWHENNDVFPNPNSYPWLSYECADLYCSPNQGKRGLVTGNTTGAGYESGLAEIATSNPFLDYSFDGNVFNIQLDIRYLGVVGGDHFNSGKIEVYGSEYELAEFAPTIYSPQYLGESETFYDEDNTCANTYIPLSSLAADFPYLIFRLDAVSVPRGNESATAFVDVVIDNLNICEVIDVDITSNCAPGDELCMDIDISSDCLPCVGLTRQNCPYSIIIADISDPDGNEVYGSADFIPLEDFPYNLCFPEPSNQFGAIYGEYTMNFIIYNENTSESQYITSVFEYQPACDELTISVSTDYTVDNVGNNGLMTTGTITVQSGATLTIEEGVTLAFCDGASLIIEPNAKVELYGTLTACGDKWEGVKVYGTADFHSQSIAYGVRHVGFLETFEGAEISYANHAVDLFGADFKGGGIIKAEGTTFKNFYQRGIKALPFENHNAYIPSILHSYEGNINDCEFIIEANFQPDYGPRMIDLNGVRGVKIKGSSFVNNQTTATPNFFGQTHYGTGIYSLGSSFILTEGNKFHGLAIGIHNVKYPGQPDKLFVIKETEFRECGYGFYNLIASLGKITNNEFYFGKVRPGIASYVESNSSNSGNTVKQIGAMMQGYQTGFVFEENHFMLDANPTHLDNIGTISSYLGPVNNRIRRNFYDDMLIGNLSNGENADPGDKIEGLIYLCNENTNPSNLSDFAIVAPVGICTYQEGDYVIAENATKAAGNIFSYANSPVADINNQAEIINYKYYEYGYQEEPRTSNSAGNFYFQSTTILNECPQEYFPSGDDREKKVDVEKAENEFWEHHALWGALQQEYYEKLDGGNTIVLLDEINNTNLSAGGSLRPLGGQSESWVLLNNKLQEISPYLSADVIKAVSEKGMYAKEGLSELLYANPDVKLDKAYYESLLSNVAYEFTNEEIEGIKTGIRDIQTERTELEAQIGYHRKQMDLRAGDILRTLLNEDEIETGLTQEWYANMSNDFGNFHLAMQAATEGEYSTARQMIEQIPIDAHYDSYQTKQHGFTTDLTELIIKNLSEGIELNNLDEDNKVALWDIYNQSESIAKYQAAALLHINKEGDFMEYTVPENINALARQFNNEQYDILQNKVQNDSDFTIFPNPTSDEVALTGKIPSGSRLVISDMKGKVWKNIPASNNIQLVDIPNGIYVCHILSEGKIIHFTKFVIMK